MTDKKEELEATISVTRKVSDVITLKQSDVAFALNGIIFAGFIDPEAEGDLITSKQTRCTFAGGPDWQISDDPHVATLVDAFNILLTGKPYHLEDFIGRELQEEYFYQVSVNRRRRVDFDFHSPEAIRIGAQIPVENGLLIVREVLDHSEDPVNFIRLDCRFRKA